MNAEDNYSTAEEMKEYFLQKTNILSNCLKYRPFEKNLSIKFSSLELCLSGLNDVFYEIRKELVVAEKNAQRMQNLLVKVENIKLGFEHMDKNFPSVLKKPTVPSENKVKGIPSSAIKETEHPVKAKTQKELPQMQYVTVQEYDSVPKYMKGRLKYEQINKFVDDINSALEKKYQLLRLPRKELKQPQLQIVQKLKSQENSATKGLYFCSTEDLKEYGNIKMDKITTNIITILRHCSKVKEIRSPGIIRYAVVM